MSTYPIELDLAGKRVLVVGLGAVGRRKAVGLIAAGAKVVGVDPAVDSIVDVEIYNEPYRSSHLDLITLVFAAATPEINRQVVCDAKARGIWVNAASDPDLGDFRIPATWSDGPITLTVSTSGASPALAAMLRDRATDTIGPEAAPFAKLLKELRPLLLAKVDDPEERRRIAIGWADPQWLRLWQEQGEESVRAALLRSFEG